MHSIVLMENGAEWSSRVDHEAGERSHVIVIAKNSAESVDEFAKRVRFRLDRASNATRGILVLGAKSTLAMRASAGRALVETIRRNGGGEIVVIGEGQPKLTEELDAFVKRMNRRGSNAVSLRYQPSTSATPIRRVA